MSDERTAAEVIDTVLDESDADFHEPTEDIMERILAALAAAGLDYDAGVKRGEAEVGWLHALLKLVNDQRIYAERMVGSLEMGEHFERRRQEINALVRAELTPAVPSTEGEQ